MSIDVTLTSYILNPWTNSGSTPIGYHGGTSNLIALSYANLDFTPSASDPYKSTSGDVFKVYVNGTRIYRQSDQDYAGGSGFLEDGDTSGQTLNGVSAAWTATNNTVWEINTALQLILLNVDSTTGVASTTLYGPSGLNVSFAESSSAPIIELRRAVQDLKTPAIDFSNASILTEQDLDNSAKNVFHVSQQAVISTENAMLFDSGTDTYKATQPGTSNPKRISNVDTPTATTDAANKSYVDGSSSTVTVAGSIAQVEAVAGQITPTNNIATVANSAYKTDIETVADSTYKGKVETVAESVYKGKVETVADSTYKGKVETVAESVYKGKVETVADSTYKTKVEAVAGKEQEVGLLGQSAVITDMGLLGDSAVIADMALLGDSAVIADMALLGDSNVISDMALLGDSNVIADMNLLGTSDAVADMNLLGTTENVSNMDTCADNITNVNAVAGSIAGSLTYAVTVATYSGSDYFYLDGIKNPTITLTRGFTYTFDQSAGTNSGHLLLFKDSAGNAYTNGVTSSGTLGQAGAKTVFVVPANAPDSLRYYCSAHGNNMGNTITVVNNDLGAVAAVSSNLNIVATNAESNAIVMGIALG